MRLEIPHYLASWYGVAVGFATLVTGVESGWRYWSYLQRTRPNRVMRALRT